MRIVCPSCAAAYEVSDALVRSRRSVRCAKCSTEWKPDPGDASPPDEATGLRPAAAIEPTLADVSAGLAELSERSSSPGAMRSAALARDPQRDAPPESKGSGRKHSFGRETQAPLVWAAWAVSIAVLVLFCWAAYTWRAEVMQIWPPSQRLYAALGLRSTLE